MHKELPEARIRGSGHWGQPLYWQVLIIMFFVVFCDLEKMVQKNNASPPLFPEREEYGSSGDLVSDFVEN